MSQDVKRWETISIDTKLPGTRIDIDGVPRILVMPVTEHESIVAELKAEIEALKRSELVNQIKGGQDYGDALDEIANLKRTLARRDRVIEKLREQRNACNGWHMSEEFMDKELEDIEQGEGM